MTGRPVAIVTGAGSGIGRAVAIGLGERGYDLALAGRRTGPLSETAAALDPAASAMICPTDLADPSAVRAFVAGAIGRFARLDALVNNAGAAELIPLERQDDEAIARTFRINAIAPITAVCAALPALRVARGVVVNVSSMATFDPFPGLGVYAAAKAAAEAVCLAVRNEAGAEGVRAYAVAPGAVETPMLRAILDEGTLPRERALDPERVAAVIVACVTGHTDAPSGSVIRLPSP